MINGNKYYIGKQILSKIIELYPDRDTIIYEPFVGGFGMTCHLLSYYNKVIVSDINPYIPKLIYEILFNNFKVPTNLDYYSKEKYDYYKNIYKQDLYNNLNKSAQLEFCLIGLVCSVMKSFYNSGYNGNLIRNFRQECLNYLIKIITILDKFKHNLIINVESIDYSNITINDNYNNLIYCDIPYKTKNDKHYGKIFDHEKFYQYCYKYKNIIISEYNMPNNFECILEVNKFSGFKGTLVKEKLYKFKGSGNE